MEFITIFLGILLFQEGLHQLKASFTIKPTLCSSCVKVGIPSPFVLLHSEEEKEHDFSIMINQNSECISPARSAKFVYSPTTALNYLRYINLTFVREGEQSIIVTEIDAKDTLMVFITVGPRKYSACYDSGMEITLGGTKVKTVEELNQVIPFASEHEVKSFKVIRSSNQHCHRKPKVFWMVERFWEYYKPFYCVMEHFISQVNLAAFNGLRSYIPADVTDDAEEFYAPPYFLPCGLLRIRMFLHYPDEDIVHEKRAFIRVIRENRNDETEFIKMTPEPYQIMKRTGTDLILDASSSYSIFLSSQSGFSGDINRHFQFHWICTGYKSLCRHISGSDAPKIFIPGSETRNIQFGATFTVALELTTTYPFPLDETKSFNTKVTSEKIVTYEMSDVPNFDIRCLLNCGEKVRPGSPLMLRADFEFEPDWNLVEWTVCDGHPACTFMKLDEQYIVIDIDVSTRMKKFGVDVKGYTIPDNRVQLIRSYHTKYFSVAFPKPYKKAYSIKLRPNSWGGAPWPYRGSRYQYKVPVGATAVQTSSLLEYFRAVRRMEAYGITNIFWLVNGNDLTRYSQRDLRSVIKLILTKLAGQSLSYQEAYLSVMIIERLTKSLLEPLLIETVEMLFQVLHKVFLILAEAKTEDYSIVKQIIQCSLKSLCSIMTSFDDENVMTHKVLIAADNLFTLYKEVADYHFNRTWEKRMEIFEDSCFFLFLWERERLGQDYIFEGKHSLKSISIQGSTIQKALNDTIKSSVDRNLNIQLFYSTMELMRGLEHPIKMTLGTTFMSVSSKWNHQRLPLDSFDAQVSINYKNVEATAQDAIQTGILDLEVDSSGTVVKSTCLAYKMPLAYTDRSIQFHCRSCNVQLAVIYIYAPTPSNFIDIFEEPFEEIKSNRIFMSSDALRNKIQNTEGYTVLLITAVQADLNAEDKSLRHVNITVDVSYHDMICAFWRDQNWDLSSCKVSTESTPQELHCKCDQVGTFSGRIKYRDDLHELLPLTVKAKTVEFLLTMILACIWLIYLALLVWSHRIDRIYRYANRTFVPPSPAYSVRSPYQFLICLSTSVRIGSGTTSRVGLGLIGSLGASPIIHLKGIKCFKVGSENWFLISTPMDLGELVGVVLYVEPVGLSPKWFLRSIHVHSLANSTTMVLICNSWISPELPRRFFPVRNIPGFFSRWFDHWTWQLSTMHVMLSLLLSPYGFHVKRVRLATILLAVTITAFIIAFHGIIGIPGDKFLGTHNNEILPVDERYLYGVLYSPFLLLVHLILAIFVYNCRSERWHVLFPHREVPPPVIRSSQPPSYLGEEYEKESEERTHLDKEKASGNKSPSSFHTAASLKLRASGVFAGGRESSSLPETVNSLKNLKGTAKEKETQRDYTVGLDEWNSFLDNLIWLFVIPYCISGTILLSLNSMNSSWSNAFNCFEIASVMLGCLMMIQEPLIALFVSLALSLRKERIHGLAFYRASNVRAAISFERKLLKAHYVRPTVSPPMSQHYTTHSLSLFYLKFKLNKVIKEAYAPPPPLLQQRAMLLLAFIILTLVVINLKTDILAAYHQTKYLSDLFNVGIHNLPRDESFQRSQVIEYLWKVLLPGIANVSAVTFSYRKPSPARLFGHTGRIRQIRSRVKFKGCEYGQSLHIKPSCREETPNEVETRNFINGWDSAPSESTAKLEQWQHSFVYQEGKWWDAYSDYLLSFPPGGYDIMIPYKKVSAWIENFKKLMDRHQWLDMKTRVVFVEMTFVNLETALASNMIIAFELRNAGIFQTSSITTFPVLIEGVQKFVLVLVSYCCIALCLFDLINISLSILSQKWISSLTNVQVYLDLFRLCAELFATVILVLDVHKDEDVFRSAIRQWTNEDPPKYISFGYMKFHAALTSVSCGSLLGVLIVQLVLEARDFARFQIFIRMLSSVFVLAFPPVIMVMAFTYFGVMLFGTLQYGYSTFALSFVQTLQFFVKPIPIFESLTEKSPLFGRLYTLLIWLFLVLFISNIYIIFLNEAYSAFKTRTKMAHQVKKKQSILDFIKTAVFGSSKKEMIDVMSDNAVSDEQIIRDDEWFIQFIHAC